MSASSHTRDHRFAAEYTGAVLAWLERYGRTIVNDSRALRLEISKVAQYEALGAFGIPTPETLAVVGRENIVPAAETLGYPLLLKHNRGGKGLGVRLFLSRGGLEEHLASLDFEVPVDGITLVVDCQVCGALLTPILGKPDIGLLSDQLLRRARKGAALLGSAVTLNSVSQIRRAMRGVAFAMALTNARGTPAAALQSYNPEVRLFCLAAIAVVQKRPLLKAALFTTGIDDFARVALLRTYHREARLLATVDRIACRIQHRVRTLRSRSSEQS